MSTQALVEEILRLSGPFVDDRARLRHRRWLERRSTEKLLLRRQELLDTAGRPGGQRQLNFADELR